MSMRATAVLVLSASMTAAAVACDDDIHTCTDQGCEPAYTAHLEAPEPDLEVGLWRVDLDIDGATISAECMVAGPNEGPESMSCELGAWTVDPERPIDVRVSVNTRIGPGSGEPTDSGNPPEESNQGIFVTVSSGDGEAPLETLDMVVQFEDSVVLETQRSPSHELIEDFNGPGCGSCLRDVEDVIALP